MKFRNLFVVVFICFNYSSYSQNVINCEIEKIIVNDISKCYSKNFNCFMIHRKQISYDSSTMKLDWYKRLVIDEKNDFLIDSVVKLYLIKPFDSCFLESKQFNNFKFKMKM